MLSSSRYLRIVLFFGRLAFHIIFWEIILRKFGLIGLARRTATQRYVNVARRYRKLAARMGGVLIKVGQFLSTRVDILPECVTEELSGLQDEVPGVAFTEIRAMIEREFNLPLEELFESFNPQPLASASLGQAHEAVYCSKISPEPGDDKPEITLTSEEVVVKVQRPGIEKIVEIDLAALRTAIGWLKHWKTVSVHADMDSLLTEFQSTLLDELDYLAEAKNAQRFGEMFKDDPAVRIPRIIPERLTQRVITLEAVGNIKITDYEAITKAGIDRAEVARKLLNVYLHMIFVENFFHADPHPGNLFVEPSNGDGAWRLVFVDFGMVGIVTPEIRRAGREAVVALAMRDSKRLIQAIVESGMLLPGADLQNLSAAYEVLFKQYWGKTMDELRQIDAEEINGFMKQFRDLLYDLPFQIPKNMIYLGRCIAILSGMCTGLYPDFNLFAELEPFAQQLVAEEFSGEGADFWLDELKKLFSVLIAMPQRLDQALNQLERGELTVITQPPREQIQQLYQLTAAINRLAGGIVFFGMLAAATLLYVSDFKLIGGIGWGLAFIILVWMLLQGK